MKIILVSHGPFSKGIMESVQMVVGAQENLSADCLMPEEEPSALYERLEKKLKEAGEEEILFFTDLFHGSPFNVLVSLMRDYKFYHITGMNMAILIDAIMSRNIGMSAEEICEQIMEEASGTIVDVNKLLEEGEDEE